MKKTISGSTITFAFEGLDSVIFDAAKVHTDVTAQAVMHGFSARIGDAAAIPKNEANNFTVTEAMRKEEVVALVNHYESGSAEWNIGGRAKKAAPQNATILKIAEARGCTYEQAEAYIAEKFTGELISL